MILKSFKQNSAKKYLETILESRSVTVDSSKIQSLGIILNLDEDADFEAFKWLSESINIKFDKVKIIAFSSVKKDQLNTSNICYNSKDFGWNGKIKNAELKSFLDTKFDALISYYTSDVLELKLMTAVSKAQFKIGILQSDNRLNDLILKTNLNQLNVFQSELKKYLKIFNKINNE